jgi:hypothetical protein
VITIGSPSNSDADRSAVIQRGSEQSGGQLDLLLAPTALPARLEALAAELTNQVRVVYSRPQSLIPPDRVGVTAVKPGLTVRGSLAQDPGGQNRP